MLDQMCNTKAPIVKRLEFQRIIGGDFFRRPDYCKSGEIFYAYKHGDFVMAFRVKEDGTISHEANLLTNPDSHELVDLVRADDLGITKIEFSKAEAPAG